MSRTIFMAVRSFPGWGYHPLTTYRSKRRLRFDLPVASLLYKVKPALVSTLTAWLYLHYSPRKLRIPIFIGLIAALFALTPHAALAHGAVPASDGTTLPEPCTPGEDSPCMELDRLEALMEKMMAGNLSSAEQLEMPDLMEHAGMMDAMSAHAEVDGAVTEDHGHDGEDGMMGGGMMGGGMMGGNMVSGMMDMNTGTASFVFWINQLLFWALAVLGIIWLARVLKK